MAYGCAVFICYKLYFQEFVFAVPWLDSFPYSPGEQ